MHYWHCVALIQDMQPYIEPQGIGIHEYKLVLNTYPCVQFAQVPLILQYKQF